MKARTLLSIYGVVMILGGLSWLVLPAQNMAIYGLLINSATATIVRYAGSLAIAVGLIAWGVRVDTASPAGKAAVLGITASNGLATIVCLAGALSGNFNSVAWATTAGFAVFTGLFVATVWSTRGANAAVPAM